MNLICFFLGHNEDFDPYVSPVSWCERCGHSITEYGYPVEDAPPSLWLSWRIRSKLPPNDLIIMRCPEGHIKSVFGFSIGNHNDCDDIPF